MFILWGPTCSDKFINLLKMNELQCTRLHTGTYHTLLVAMSGKPGQAFVLSRTPFS